METKTSKPTAHVKVLSGFYYLVSGCLFLTGLVYCLMSGFLKNSFTDNAIMQETTTDQFVLYGIVMIALSVLEALLALNLWKLKKWARIVALVISSLGLLWAVVAIFVYGGLENLFFIALHGYFMWVLSTKYDG